MDLPTQYAIGAFIQALGQNPGLEAELRRLGTEAHVYVGTGLGALATIAALDARPAPRAAAPGTASGPSRSATPRSRMAVAVAGRAQGRPRRAAAAGDGGARRARGGRGGLVATTGPSARPSSQQFLAAAARDRVASPSRATSRAGKMPVMKEKQRRRKKLQREWGAPDPPWTNGLAQRAVEHPQHAGGADLDAGQDHRPGLRAGRRLLHLRRDPEAGHGRHRARRGQGGGDRRHRPAAASAHRRRASIAPA